MQLCIACSATLDSTQSTPTNTEKPAFATTFSCQHSVCASCTSRRTNLAKSCILCESVHDVLGNSTTSTSTSQPPSRSTLNPPSYTQDGFVLGDDSDDDETDLSPPPPPPLPAPLEEESPSFDPDQPPAYDDPKHPHDDDYETNEKEGTKRDQCNIHYIKPDETLLGLSLSYSIEGSLLCRMNRLPISTLSTTPHLLHTLPFLLLPPTARPSTSTKPLLPPAEERKRLLIRRFQIATRCTDYAVAKAYIDQVSKAREEEAEFLRRNRGIDEVVEVREGGELEEAKKSYEADERWELEQRELGGKGKGKALFGSKIRTTGEVENSGLKKGWGWR